MPIVPEEETALRRQLEEEARHVDWLAAARHEAAQEEQALAIEPPAGEAEAKGPVIAESARVEDIGPEGPAAEKATLDDVVAETNVTETVAVEPAPPVADEEPVPADEEVSTDAEPARERREGQEEDRS
jgi:hypothetical protein